MAYPKVKALIKKSFVYRIVTRYRILKAKRNEIANRKKILKQWELNGKPVPPPHVYKTSVIKLYAKHFHIDILIETGTYLGETVTTFKNYFKKIISIELDQKLFENAAIKFASEKHISIYQGDSGEVLKNIIANISQPCLFWLDGHYSEGITAKGELNTPIIKELTHILNHHIKHVILIDDARCFTGKDDYPTIQYLKDFVLKYHSDFKFIVENDIIRIT